MSRVVPWLAPVASAALMIMAGAAGHSGESGSRAGAEPVPAALLIAAPFAVITLVNVACAIALSVPWSRPVHLGALTLQTLASATLVAAVTWLWISSYRPSEV